MQTIKILFYFSAYVRLLSQIGDKIDYGKNTRLSVELSGFTKVWKGGYFEGDPLDVLSKSTYDQVGYMSVLHATYLRCIKPYINSKTIALEIGPGRGRGQKHFPQRGRFM